MTATRKRSSSGRAARASAATLERTKKSPSKKGAAKKSSPKKSSSKKSTARKTPKKGAAKKRTTKKRPPSTKRGTTQRSSRASESLLTNERALLKAKRSTRDSSGQKRKSVTPVGERNAAYLMVVFVGLTLFGLVMVLSASSVYSEQYANTPFYFFKRQAVWAAIGFVGFMVASRIDYRIIRKFAGPALIGVILLLIAVIIPGVGITSKGSTRWVGYGPVVVQPSEFAKLALIVFIAHLLALRERRMDRPELTTRPVLLTVAFVSSLVVLQPKLGTPLIFCGVAFLMLFIAGARIRSLLLWGTSAAAAALTLALVVGYRRERITSFLDPWADPQGAGFQAIQSQVGISSGGLLGVGLGASRAKWGFLPFAHNDFIFAIVAEEVGLVGSTAFIAAFILVAVFGIRAALQAPDRFGLLLAAGITCWLLVQAFLNIGMVLGVLAITGEPLPFISAGGSSLVTTLVGAGLLTSVARHAVVEE